VSVYQKLQKEEHLTLHRGQLHEGGIAASEGHYSVPPISVVFFKKKPDAAAMAGCVMIVVSVVVIDGFAKMSAHW